MKIKSFKKFNEALKPSQYRKYMRAAQEVNYKDRYKELFQKWKRVYSGDKNAFRIYLPYEQKLNIKSETQKKVEELLKELGFDLESKFYNYIKGRVKYDDAKNVSYIGRIIRRAIKDGKADKKLLDEYATDKLRKSNQRSDLLVCISRHPYDIVGADTDRKWSNCMTLGHYNQYKNHFLIRGDNTRYILGDIKQGSLIAYLIQKDDKDIQHPLANISIKPYENEEIKNDIILIPDNRIYGQPDENFKTTVFKWCEMVNKGKIGKYRIKPGLYWDNQKRHTDIITGIEYEGEEDKYKGIAYDYLPKSMKESLDTNAYKLLKLLDYGLLDEYIGNIIVLELQNGKIIELQIDEEIKDYYIWDSMELFEASVDTDLEDLQEIKLSNKIVNKLEVILNEKIKKIYNTIL